MDIETPLLDEGSRDGSVVMPELRRLLVLACSDDTDQQVQVRIAAAVEYHTTQQTHKFWQ